MIQMNVSTDVAAEPARVFALASDFPNLPGHVAGIIRVEMLTDGPVGVGTRFKETRKFGGRQATETMVVAEFDAPRSYVLKARSCGSIFRSRVRVEPAPGGARLSIETTAKADSLFARLLSPLVGLMAKSMKKCLEDDLAQIKQAAEKA